MFDVGVARWQAESSQQLVAESLPGCERRVNNAPRRWAFNDR
jgi:hypothetical protein